MVIKKIVCTRGMGTKTLHIYLTVTLHMNSFMPSLADGVENAVVICCFVTPDYGKSENCKLEVEYAQKRGKPLIPCNLGNASTWKPTAWLRSITRGNIWIDFNDISESNIDSKTRELVGRINEKCLSTLHLTSQSVDGATYLFELMKHEYRRNSRIQRFKNPAKSFPIEDSYINLIIVETKEQREKEKELSNAKNNNKMVDTFERIYSTESPINVKDLFKYCKDQLRQVLVFGRAGIGKSTFCQYVTHEWARGELWPEYDLVVLFPLRLLTETRYPPVSSLSYSLIDVVEKEYFSHGLCEKEKQILTNQLSRLKVLWLLDGYDEIVQNVPSHLQCLFQQMLKIPHRIITSRPYSNTLSNRVQMEITGFTNENISQYVTQFFNQIQEELDDASNQAEKCLEFLKVNSRVWGIAHIPVNLELICSIWGDTDWSETKNMTMTTLYDNLTDWLCRRCLIKQKSSIEITQEDIDEQYSKELEFLEILAFIAMVNNTVLIRKELLQKAMKEAQCSLRRNPPILNIGILKSYDSGATGNRFESDKHHYFVHLSFQEYFAARYVCKALKDPPDQTVMRLIQNQKYDRHFTIMLTFASGLLTNANDGATLNRFWDLVHNKCRDLIGFRHLQLLVPCIDEGRCSDSIETKDQIVQYITNWVQYILSLKHCVLQERLQYLFRTCTTLAEQSVIQTFLLQQLQTQDQTIAENVLLLISTMSSPDSSAKLFPLVSSRLDAPNSSVRSAAVWALAKLGETAATGAVISRLIISIRDSNWSVRSSVCEALRTLGEKVATSEIINPLVILLGDSDRHVRSSACETLGELGAEAVTSEVISRLVISLGDGDWNVRGSACQALGRLGEKAATNEIINQLVITLGDSDKNVRESACQALGRLGEKSATNEVINRLVNSLGNRDCSIQSGAREVLKRLGEKAGASEVISQLVVSLGHSDVNVRWSACEVLGRLDEKAATSEVISRLFIALRDTEKNVRLSACEALGTLGEKAAMSKVISQLVVSLGHSDVNVRWSACEVLGRLDEKAATSEVISRLFIALRDTEKNVRLSACEALGTLGEKAAMSKVISQLVVSLGDSDWNVRSSARELLGRLGEKAATSEVINGLIISLGDSDENVRESACEVLGRLGEKAATSEVISRLVVSLGDCDENVRWSACDALGRFGEKAATSEVISRLVVLLGDSEVNVRSSACEALGRLGEQAATSEVISRLFVSLGNSEMNVRSSACEALGRLGEQAATSEVINGLVVSLGDSDWNVRSSACEALGRLGEKAGTSEVIRRLVVSLGDSDWNVRSSACEALGRLGEQAATSEVINGLVISLGDSDKNVRWSACEALGRLGEQAATNEVINGMVISLGDSGKTVRWSACEALGRLGEKAATSEVINGLVVSLGDSDRNVRSSACEALGRLGEKAGTSEVIRRLVVSLGDSDWNVRSSACEALGRFGEKAATSEVINRLVIALGDSAKDVRASVCRLLERLGEKAATSEVISRLVMALGDSDWNVRASACRLLKRLGEKAATSEVISRLVMALGDSDWNVRASACRLLGRLGEKAATSEVISTVAIALGYDDSWTRLAAVESMNKLVSILWRRNGVEVSSLPENGERWMNEDELVENSNICMTLFELLQKSADSSLIPGCLAAAAFGECYVIMSENRIVVSGDTQALKIELSDSMKREILKGFDNLWGQITNVYGTGGALPGQKLKRSKS